LPRPPRRMVRQTPHGVPRPCPGSHWHRDHRPATVFPALSGRRVRRRLTPTRGGYTPQPLQVETPPLMRHLPLVGARRRLARRAKGAADLLHPPVALAIPIPRPPSHRALIAGRPGPTARAPGAPDQPSGHLWIRRRHTGARCPAHPTDLSKTGRGEFPRPADLRRPFRSTARSRPARLSCPSPCRPALPRAP